MSDTSERILDVAEQRMRMDGYNAVSFRQLADETRIKSASVHYHFPTKEDLGVAVVERYQRNIAEVLGDPMDYPDPHARVAHFASVFRQAKLRDGMICLCGMLGAESGGLPDAVKAAVSDFFDYCVDWLDKALESPDAHDSACFILSSLEGAMIVAQTMGDDGIFESVSDQVTALAGS